MSPRRVLLTALGWCWLAAIAGAGENLAVDASFESPLPAWFAEHSGTSYYAGKEEVGGAADGRNVLAIEAWDKQGSRILSEPVSLAGQEATAPVVSATAAVRCRGKTDGATFELALFDEKGQKKLASFGQLPLDGKTAWQTVAKSGVALDRSIAKCRLALVVRGAEQQGRVEVDCVGLFRGPSLGPCLLYTSPRPRDS